MEKECEEKTFVLGVGAAKSGTHWLYDYLTQTGKADMGIMKEYHIWDALTVPECSNRKVSASAMPRLFARLLLHRESFHNLIRRLHRFRIQRKPGLYFDYFEKILNQPQVCITGDITPSYSALSSDVLRSIFETFRARGIEVKVIFIMRDPVDRCWSKIRMVIRDRKRRGLTTAEDPERMLVNYAATNDAWIRTAYDQTIRNLERVIPSQNVHLALYESLFTRSGLESLSGFVGVPAHYESLNVRANESGQRQNLSDETVRTVATQFESTYRYVATRFPQVRELWKGFSVLDSPN